MPELSPHRRLDPPRLTSFVDPKGADPLPTGGAGRAAPPRLTSFVDRHSSAAAPRGYLQALGALAAATPLHTCSLVAQPAVIT
jgi:hypothetical protein